MCFIGSVHYVASLYISEQEVVNGLWDAEHEVKENNWLELAQEIERIMRIHREALREYVNERWV